MLIKELISLQSANKLLAIIAQKENHKIIVESNLLWPLFCSFYDTSECDWMTNRVQTCEHKCSWCRAKCWASMQIQCDFHHHWANLNANGRHVQKFLSLCFFPLAMISILLAMADYINAQHQRFQLIIDAGRWENQRGQIIQGRIIRRKLMSGKRTIYHAPHLIRRLSHGRTK